MKHLAGVKRRESAFLAPESGYWMDVASRGSRMRRNGKLWLIAPLVCFWPMGANAESGDAANLVTECGALDLPQATLDSCLERVRVREETDPSPQLQALEASLEQRETGHPVRTQSAAATSHMVEVAPERDAVTADENEQDTSSPQPEQAQTTPRSGVTLEDEPPVSDAPEGAAGTDPEDDTGDPPQ